MYLPSFRSPTRPAEKLKDTPMPAHTANPWSKLVFSWPNSVFKVARKRQLAEDDMWDIEPNGQCRAIADQVMEAFQQRVAPSKRTEGYHPLAAAAQEKMLSPDQSPSSTTTEGTTATSKESLSNPDATAAKRAKLAQRYGRRKAKHIISGKYAEEDGKVYDQSLMTAVHHVFAKDFYWAILLCVLGYGVPMALPVLTKGIFDNISAVRAEGQTGVRPAATTVGLAVGLLALMVFGELCKIHTRRISNTMGFILRGAVIDLISRKSMRLSTKARRRYPDGRINASIAADASVCEWAFTDMIQALSYPVVIIVGIALITHTIGVAGLAGIGILLLTAPTQSLLFKALIKARLLHLDALDERTKPLTEVVRNLLPIKLYAYEPLFGKVIQEKREKEAKHARTMTITRSLGDIIGTVAPPIAAVVTFTVYTALGKTLTLGTTFATLSLFLFIQKPLSVLPRFIATLSNTLISARRISQFLVAEERQMSLHIDPSSPYALTLDASFEHEMDSDDDASDKTTDGNPETAPKPGFRLDNVQLRVARGQLVCIVGRVGTGKSSLLDGLLGDVKRTRGSVTFGGSCGYVPQEAWVQSGSIRSNITFAAPFDADAARLAEVTRASALDEDLRELAEGVDTQIGERGINLSGGQKQRICMARAAYAESDVVLLDDPLSAVDAQVGRHILHNCILSGPLADRTRILVTHHLEVLPYADHVVMVDSDGSVGRIAQQGSYKDLLAQEGPFQQLMRDFGSDHRGTQTVQQTADPVEPAAEHEKPEGKAFAEEEEREVGAVSLSTWLFWLNSMGNPIFVAAAFFGYIIASGSQIVHAFFLAQWQSNAYPNLSQGGYQGIYAGIGVACALLSFASTALFIILVIKGSIWACMTALHRVMRSPMSFLDRTPSGRIISRLTKDVETIDLYFAHTMHMALVAGLGFLGAVGLVGWTLPWLVFAYLPAYYLIFSRSQPANRDVKRLDSVTRSRIYSGFMEQVVSPLRAARGSTVIRAFGRTDQFERDLQVAIDEQNRFTLFREYSTGWLNVRISCALFLIPFAVALFGALDSSISPARFALTLTFVLRSIYALTDVMPWISDIEQEMNALERLKHYCNLEQEAAATLPSDPDAKAWPSKGAISFQDVKFRYRAELPMVLKGLTFDVKPGEKVGIVGRTGAGKSSLVQAIERTVELSSGTISVDGVDLKTLGLHTMRSRMAIIPQSPFCFSGTVRRNIDPERLHTDAVLNDALSLIHSSPAASISIRDKFKLDTEVESEGSNFSAGERQLLALIRALVRGNRILILDEATSSIDPETDALVQRIIQKEFADVTLLSIAHRLQTVAYYDRILVMEAGQVVEYDTPLNLFDKPGSVFRSLCDVKQISRQDLLNIQAAAKAM